MNELVTRVFNGIMRAKDYRTGLVAHHLWWVSLLVILCISTPLIAANLFIPMDDQQTDHLKAYGAVFKSLEEGHKAEWLLNYRGGSFLIEATPDNAELCLLMGVSAEQVTEAQVSDMYRQIESENMERVELEKAPKIAVYSPPNSEPWDDAVTLALTYAEVAYDVVWD